RPCVFFFARLNQKQKTPILFRICVLYFNLVVDVLVACLTGDLFGLGFVGVALYGSCQLQLAIIGYARRNLIPLRQLFVELLLYPGRRISRDASRNRRCRRATLWIRSLALCGSGARRRGRLMLVGRSA